MINGKFTEADLELWPYRDTYLLEILNGEYDVVDARDDLNSLIVREWEKSIQVYEDAN